MPVFAVHPIEGVDISPATAFGEIIYINHRYVYSDQLEPDDSLPLYFRKKIDDAADKFNPLYDFLLIAGDHMQLLAMTAALISKYPYFKALRYDREAKGYAVVRIGSKS